MTELTNKINELESDLSEVLGADKPNGSAKDSAMIVQLQRQMKLVLEALKILDK